MFDYSTRRLLDLLSKATPAGGIPLGGTVTFQFCTLALGNSQARPSPEYMGFCNACAAHMLHSALPNRSGGARPVLLGNL